MQDEGQPRAPKQAFSGSMCMTACSLNISAQHGLDILSACSDRILVLNMLALISYPCVGHRLAGSEQPACAWGPARVIAQMLLRFDGSHVVRLLLFR